MLIFKLKKGIKMTIYLDIVFFENLILNYIIILSTAIISKSHIYLGRIIIASSIGGIFI